MSDYNFLMDTRLSPEQLQVVNTLSRLAAGQMLNLYLVGGAVRDLTFGQQIIRDLDFALEGSPQKVLKQLEAARGGRRAAPEALRLAHARYNSRLESADLVFSNGVRAELAMCRSEFYPKPGRRPEISPAPIFDDLKRRDFSVNAMAVSLHPNSRGLLLDPTNGAADIERQELRVLHTRSFSEDPLRLYRLLRLGLRLGFKPDERTAGLFANAIEYGYWTRLDADQQAREIQAILHEENPARVLKALSERGLLKGLDRKLASVPLNYDRFARIRAAAQSLPGADPFLLNFLCLTEKFGGGLRKRLARRVIQDPREARFALALEKGAKKLARLLSSGKASKPSQVYLLLEDQPRVLLLYLLVHFPQAKVQTRLKAYLNKFPQVRARIPRGEIQALGIEPGPKLEKVIEQLFLDTLDGKIKTHPQLLKAARAIAGIPEPKPEPKPKPKPAPKKSEPKPAATKAEAPAPQAVAASKKKAVARKPSSARKPRAKPQGKTKRKPKKAAGKKK
jgi:tRNA nucleotidyltransferase (CCA-adding enzyme)